MTRPAVPAVSRPAAPAAFPRRVRCCTALAMVAARADAPDLAPLFAAPGDPAEPAAAAAGRWMEDEAR